MTSLGRAVSVVALAVALSVVGGCSAQDTDPAESPQASDLPAGSASETARAGDRGAAEPTSGPPSVANEAAPESLSTEDRSSPAASGGPVRVTSTAVEHDGDVDRIVVTSEGGLPGWSARYVEAVRIEGEPVLLEGSTSLELVLVGADPNGEEGLRPDVAIEVEPAEGQIAQVSFARYVDGAVTYAVGLREQQPFRVLEDEPAGRLTFEFGRS